MTQLTNAEFKIQTAVLYPTNGVGAISATDLREQMDNLPDSVSFKTTGATVAPGATDDGANTGGNGAIEVGDFWLDETADIAYICLDNATSAAIWAIIASTASTVNISGTPINNQLGVWTAADTMEGTADLTWDGTTLSVTGSATVSGDLTVTGDLVANPTIIAVASSRSLALTDASDILEIDTSGGAVNITIDPNATTSYIDGTIITITLVDSASAATITAGAAVTLNGISTGVATLDSTDYVGASLYRRSSDTWIIQGAVTVV